MVGLRRTYGTVTALDDLSFEVPAGRVVGFLGPNGAGKTTTMRAIFGLTDLDAGEAAVLDLGATKHEHQPGKTFRVFLDPAGHPFCLCVD